MTAKKSTGTTLEEKIIAMYMSYVLENEAIPKSVYKFCKLNNIKETDFYSVFGSLEGLQRFIWVKIYDKTIDLIEKNKEYQQYANREKMLAFFFSFFESLTLNRSYVLFTLGEHSNGLRGLEQLRGLRSSIRGYAEELIEERNAGKSLKISKYNPKIFSEGAWFQFLFLLKFWMDDASADFEKTDIAIEKSVNTIFDVFDNTPLDRVIDFGKFLFKERFA